MSGNAAIARLLGYAGLIPFLAFASLSWLGNPVSINLDSERALISYAAIILAFMGAVHWGVIMSRADDVRSNHLIVSVMPALIAWPTILMPVTYALSVLVFGFIAVIMYDLSVAQTQRLPGWYIPLRKKLSVIVIACLTATLIRVVQQ